MRDLPKTLGFPDSPTGSPADVQDHLFGVVTPFGARSHFRTPLSTSVGTSREPPSPPNLLALLDRFSERRLHHRARDRVSAHLEDGPDEALDTEPGVLPGAVAHRQSLNFWCMLADRSCRGSEHLHAEESAAGMRTLSLIPRRGTSCRAIARVVRSIQGYASGN